MLASAGIVGLAASLAARPTIENLVAGLQIALSEPIRLEHVVVANGEWGRSEEINTTYVVVRTWDLRRLILPLSYFIQTPLKIGRGGPPICSRTFICTSIKPCRSNRYEGVYAHP